ncbi:hypothetical protein EKE94_01600 [Mesobaculum littorinae]|uniref:Hedgehog/Intein (Hint) domain-containing protein n=1 Tax=Mesobaculum littorinae TaxID=2486419 RepID=A0A438AKR4_9RHOB|nr:Hint domain-containing protein [Mesobaculum littorinae]RVV99411.1 hypothetical protein EKE94_01600 [Mesobaculum littorinae]
MTRPLNRPSTWTGASPGRACADRVSGFAPGVRILTAEGLIPVEFLGAGDRIVTRDGLRALTAIETRQATGLSLCRINPGTFGHDLPMRPCVISPATPLLFRGWRARAIYDRPAALVAGGRLAGGGAIERLAPGAARTLLSLVFETAQIVYAEGLEIGVPAPVRAAA